jgi:hypothetical protein
MAILVADGRLVVKICLEGNEIVDTELDCENVGLWGHYNTSSCQNFPATGLPYRGIPRLDTSIAARTGHGNIITFLLEHRD